MSGASIAGAHESPRQNMAHSQRYEWMLAHDQAFRHHRMVKECGPLANDPDMFRACMSSF